MNNRDVEINKNKELNADDKYVVNVDLIRERCRRARIYNQMSSTTASELMGYTSNAMLSRMESTSSTDTTINYTYIIKASLVYGVSTDYLLGLSDYAEREPKTIEQLAIYNSIKKITEQLSDEYMNFILKNLDSLSIKSSTLNLIKKVKVTTDKLDRLRELNPCFDEDLRGGSSFIYASESLLKQANDLKILIDKNEDEIKQFKSVIEDCKEEQCKTLQHKLRKINKIELALN